MTGIPQDAEPRRETESAPNDASAEPAANPAVDAAPQDEAPADAGGSTALQEDPEQVRAERDEYRDRWLRSVAEFDNYRKRVERERRELVEFAAADLIRELLPLVDDLERALAAEVPADASDAVKGYRAGVELIHKQILELLKKRGVTPIEALGADFDPHLHQAVMREASAEHRDGEVIAELRRGYKLGDRLLRPSMVKVATRE